MGNQQENKIESRKLESKPKKMNGIDGKEIKNLPPNDKNFMIEALKSNNEKRNLYKAKPLEKDDDLNKRARILAKQYSLNREFDNEYLLNKNYEDLGINLKISDIKLDAKQLMEEWYKEKSDFDFNDPEKSEGNNFTQMIWKSSAYFGIGYFHNEKGNQSTDNNPEKNIEEYVYIALYYPAGNVPGEFKSNVPKQNDDTASDYDQKINN